MKSSKNSLDNLVRSKRKLHKVAMVSAFLIGILTIGLLVTNYRLNDLNKHKVDELIQYQKQIENNVQASLDIKEELDKAISEITKLKKQLSAEKSVARSLKEKLTNTLNLMAQMHEKPITVTEQVDIQQQATASDNVPTINNFIGKTEQPLEKPDNSEFSLKETEPTQPDINDQRQKKPLHTDTGVQEDISISTQLSSPGSSLKKEEAPTSSEKTALKTITSKNVESSQSEKQTDISLSKPKEKNTPQPLDSGSEAPIKIKDSNEASLGDSDSSSELSPPKQALINQQ